MVTCPSCRIETHIQALSRITIQIDDGTGSLCAVVCTPDAEKLMPFTATELKEVEENSIDLHDDIAMSIEKQTIVAFIRSYETTFHGQSQLKMNVVKAYRLGEVIPRLNIATQCIEKQSPVPVLDVAGSSAIALQPKEHVSESMINVSTPVAAKGKEQLFTPSTKLILEEISSDLVSKPVKKSLTFCDDQVLSETTATNLPHGSHVSTKNKSPIKDAVSTFAEKKKELEPRVTDPIPTPRYHKERDRCSSD